MALSLVGMVIAAAGYLPPVAGAIAQEVIDVLAVVNALRMAIPPRTLTDYDPPQPDWERLEPRTSMLEVPVGSA